jgi:5'-nucleotidase
VRILLSNDDGYHADGLATLALALADLAEIVIVAPDRNQSGASHSLTLNNPLRVSKTREGIYYVNGTPTDCVHVAITGLLDYDVLYSGTVAAAIEGRFLGLPAMAVSLAGEEMRHFDTAGQAARDLVERMLRSPLPPDTILNVNVPDVDHAHLDGFETTRLGFRHRSEPVVRARDPKGREVFWVGPAGGGQDAGPGTDFHAVDQGRVSVTPLMIDLTRHEALSGIAGWLSD